MASERKCLDCGASLPAEEPQPVCPRCIFRRLARTGSTVHPPESMPATSVSEPAGRDFHAEYELLGEIGRGGMGVIYKAHQPRLNRIVALKVIHAASVGGEAARRRFQSEVEVAARLNHPNIVPVFDTGLMDGCPCFSMEYFPGGTLAARMEEFHAKPENGVRLLVKVARAVSFAHQRGVLHRDLKPANILLDDAGEPHVADFGLAKQLDSDSDVTRAGAILGSPNYMSPEQAAGKSGSLTVATDIYSLGVMLYEMLTGRTPFAAGTPLEMMRLVVEKEAQRPSTIVAKVNRDLETICLKCLRKEPEQRYHTAEELADDLERWLRHEPIQARPITGLERTRKWMRRHPALAGTTAMLIVAVVAGISGIVWQWRRAEFSRRNEATQRHRAEAALARSATTLAESLLRGGNGQAAKTSLESVPVDLRDSGWSYLMAESDSSRPLPPIGITKLDDLAAHPGRPFIFAAAHHGGKIVLFDVRDGSRSLEFEAGFPVAARDAELRLALSKTGDHLAIGRTRPDSIVIHDAVSGRRIATWDTPPSGRLEFSPDGSMLLQISADKTHLVMWNVTEGTQRWRHDDADFAASFTADGLEVVCYSRNEQLRLVKASDGAPIMELSKNYYEQFCVQPGGTMVVAGNPLGKVGGFDLGFDLDGRRQRFEFQPQRSRIRYLAFLPEGDRYLAAATLPDNSYTLQCFDLNGRPLQAVAGASGDIRIICVHPLSGELIVSAGEDRVWETTGVPPVRVIRSRHPRPSAAFWATDDTLFAPGPDETGAVLQSISGSNSPAVLWTANGKEHGQLSISADGRRAAIGWHRSARPIAVLERRGTEITQAASLKPAGPIDYVRLSPNGDRLIAVERDLTHLEFFDVATGAPAAALDVSDVPEFIDLAWLDRGQWLVGLLTTYSPQRSAVPSKQVILWDASTGQRLTAVTNHWSSRVACAEPNGRRFAEAGEQNVRIRDGATLAVLREFRAHNGMITALAWHPTRPILATASVDLAIRLWNLEDGARLEELNGPLSPPNVLSFSPGGTRLATASRDGAARIWEPRSLAPSSPQK
jgi:eukaryotic-like serine/threonine-protein kinase